MAAGIAIYAYELIFLLVGALNEAALIHLRVIQDLQGLIRWAEAGARLVLRAAGPQTPPSSAGRRRTARHTAPLARCRSHRIERLAPRSGSPRLKNEWVRPGRWSVW
jgi:hypothetical protein